MKYVVLPPKRFQPVSSPLYDEIRFRPWFHLLERRRAKIPLLQAAKSLLDLSNQTQKEVAEYYEIDEREIRDYCQFVNGDSRIPSELRPHLQLALDYSYKLYSNALAAKPIRDYLAKEAKTFRLNPRHVAEFWDVDPTFYPTGYPHR